MKSIFIALIALLSIASVFSTKYDYDNCRKVQCGSNTLCGTNVTCQTDLSTFYTCYANSVNCQSVYAMWNQMRDSSVVPDALSSCITDCSGPYQTQQVNSYFTCLKNTCLPLGQQPVAGSTILTISSLIVLIAAALL